MRKQLFVLSKISILMVLTLLFFGCATTKTNYVEDIPKDKIPGPGESLITVQRAKAYVGSMVKMQIWLNDEEVVGSIKNGVRSFIVVPNGTYTLQAGSTKVDRGNEVTLVINDEEVVFLAEPAMGIIAARFNLIETGRKKTANLVQ
jgi:hypothetical protein